MRMIHNRPKRFLIMLLSALVIFGKMPAAAADMIHSLGMPVCASLLSRKQLPFVRSWIEKYPLDLIVTSGITYSDLPEDVTITG